MDKSIYCILILCGILSQGTCSLSEENIKKVSETHSRQRRIAGGVIRSGNEVPSIVSIHLNAVYRGPATLLTTDAAITSAECVQNQNSLIMRIKSKSLDGDHYHRVVRIIYLDPNFNILHPSVNNLALVKFTPAINLRISHNRPATIFTGNLMPEDGMFEVINWDYWQGERNSSGIRVPDTHLRSIFMTLISIQYCQEVFGRYMIIGRGNLCGYAEKCKEYCHDEDTGAPLFVHNKLLGIMVKHGHLHHINPEVFMNLLDHGIRAWIHQNLPSLHLL